MCSIEILSKNTATYQQAIQAVAKIEALVQAQDAWTAQTLVEMLEQDSVKILIVFEKANKAVNNHVIGYCLYQGMFEQAEILRIGTHPNYQRQGIASKLFSTLHSALIDTQVKSLLLEVRSDNVPAIGLYEQQGFTVIHRRKGYYHVPHQPAIDALIMQRIYE